jgi:6-phosphogluconolactonase
VLINKIPKRHFGERRMLVVPGDNPTTIAFCVEHWIGVAEEALRTRGRFAVALSGGSTPKTIYEHLVLEHNSKRIDWSKVFLFWSDERAVSPNDADSNFHMAMQAGFAKLPIPSSQIFRMQAENEIEKNAKNYDETIRTVLQGRPFDLVMLGMGDDGHTASLFPYTEALKIQNASVAANFLPEKKVWRMTMTFPCINSARHAVVYVLGAGKKHTLSEVLKSPEDIQKYPSQGVGTKENPSLWIADEAAANLLI